jgi:hypothetical protein
MTSSWYSPERNHTLARNPLKRKKSENFLKERISMEANGKGIVFPGDVINLERLCGGQGTVLTDGEVRKHKPDRFSRYEPDVWLWMRIAASRWHSDNHITGYQWAWFDRHGGIEGFIISRADGPTALRDSSILNTNCTHDETREVFIGIGPNGYNVQVCVHCKQEV